MLHIQSFVELHCALSTRPTILPLMMGKQVSSSVNSSSRAMSRSGLKLSKKNLAIIDDHNEGKKGWA